MKTFIPDAQDYHWIERLRPGHFIWLVKQNCLGQVEIPYYPPENGYTLGKLALQKFAGAEYFGRRSLGTEVWYIKSDGTGFDGGRLILPIEHNLPDFPDPIDFPVAVEIRRQIAKLQAEVDQLKREVRDYLQGEASYG